MALDAEQQQVLDAILRRGKKVKPKFRKLLDKAAVETGLVEENLRNRPGGDGSSTGWRQETKSSYPNVNRLDLAASVDRFFNEAEAKAGQYKTAGELAQAVQRSAFPDRYGQHSKEAEQLLRSNGVSADPTEDSGTRTVPGVSREADRKALIVDYLQNRAPHDTTGSALLQTLVQRSQLRDTPARAVRSPAGGTPSVGADTTSSGGSPLATRGKIIGTPGVGTHTLGNWQSDNAIDIAVPVGTPVFADRSGVITRAGQLAGGGASGGGRFAGDRVQIGDGSWYGHLSKLAVKQGQRVKKGQLIGYSGEANGVAHLHYATRTGDPRSNYS